MPRRRRPARVRRPVDPVSPDARQGRLRGRPRPGRRLAPRGISGSKTVDACCWPGVRSPGSGLPCPSAVRGTWGEQPPWRRPTAAAAGSPPPLAPAACGWARMTRPATKGTRQSTAPAAASACSTAAQSRSQSPASRQRQQRLDTVDQGPDRSGRSRHGAPVRPRHTMPWMIRRWSAFGRPVSGRSGGRSGLSRSHSWSVSSPRGLMLIGEQIPAHRSGRFAYRP
jgi:hypothetical protein